MLGSLDPCIGFFKNAYTYLPAPPPVPTAAALTSSVPKEWGTRSSESEKFCTTDLDPFESRLLFSSLRSYPPAGGDPAVPRVSRDRRWSLGSSSPSRPPTKRAKVAEVDTGPLDELIPLVLDDPSRAVLHVLTKVPHQSPIMFLRLSTRRIPAHCRVPRLTFTLLLSCRFRHRPRPPSRPCSRPCMPALPG